MKAWKNGAIVGGILAVILYGLVIIIFLLRGGSFQYPKEYLTLLFLTIITIILGMLIGAFIVQLWIGRTPWKIGATLGGILGFLNPFLTGFFLTDILLEYGEENCLNLSGCTRQHLDVPPIADYTILLPWKISTFITGPPNYLVVLFTWLLAILIGALIVGGIGYLTEKKGKSEIIRDIRSIKSIKKWKLGAFLGVFWAGGAQIVAIKYPNLPELLLLTINAPFIIVYSSLEGLFPSQNHGLGYSPGPELFIYPFSIFLISLIGATIGHFIDKKAGKK